MKNYFTFLIIASLVFVSCKSKDSIAASKENASDLRMNENKEATDISAKEERIYSNEPKIEAIQKLSDHDLRALLESLRHNKTSEENSLKYRVAIQEFALRFPELVFDFFPAKEFKAGDYSYQTMLEGLSESKPELVTKWFKENFNDFDEEARLFLIDQTCLMFAYKHIDIALDIFDYGDQRLKLDRNDLKMRCVGYLFQRYGEQNSILAEQEARKRFPEGRFLDTALQGIAAGICEKNPYEALALSQKINSAQKRGNALCSIMGTWIKNDPNVAKEYFLKLPPDMIQMALKNSYVGGALVTKLAEKDAKTVNELLAKIIPTTENESIFSYAVSSMMKNSPQQALELILRMPENEIKANMVRSQFDFLAREDRKNALKEAANVTTDSGKKIAYESIADSVAMSESVTTIMQTTETIPSEYQKTFLASALDIALCRNTKEVSELFTQSNVLAKLDSHQACNLLNRTGNRLADTSDAASMKTWLNKIPIEYQEETMKGIASGMLKANAEGFTKFLSSLTDGNTKRVGVEILITELKKSDPEMAKEWEATLKK